MITSEYIRRLLIHKVIPVIVAVMAGGAILHTKSRRASCRSLDMDALVIATNLFFLINIVRVNAVENRYEYGTLAFLNTLSTNLHEKGPMNICFDTVS